MTISILTRRTPMGWYFWVTRGHELLAVSPRAHPSQDEAQRAAQRLVRMKK